ncbi:hypothetical protein [Paramaledivibacter caminithermalis]|jgi:hypothetical protein|uniref:Uncharacterized protein n=1 Tax=Paramaledivibacter caminithermalis (strain DSM 15212 / CIP 107654 / DViRD3) TaxID=1121301 RepID=A0A1M6K5L4_PARC5|nr:hypothetical protein [Paramaledivibacter caminithermalis]SHJ54232.1 hypothetical protein SAMN02745912_00273 [Paramaledivibacter caminithermalis DSM 15212]
MPTIALAGFAVGLRKSLSEKDYCVLDLMQFGDNQKPSEVIQLISYDNEINNWLNNNYNNGEIKAISTICYETTGKRGLLYSLEKIDYFGGVGQVGAVTINLPERLLDKVKQEKDVNELVANLLEEHYKQKEQVQDEA